MLKKNVFGIKDCYGCGVCAISCAKNIIRIELNEEGFYEPLIEDQNACNSCGLCVKVCSYLQEEISLEIKNIHSYAGWSEDKKIRNSCSSGGVGFEIGRVLLEEGYKACGVYYDVDRKRAEHYIATTLEEFLPSIGSKYIQSYTVNGFKAINRREKNVVIGTPCQIDSFRRYLKIFKAEDNFVLIDFFCHGVPSMHLWNRYVKEVEEKIGKVNNMAWRNKRDGWHDSWVMVAQGEKEKQYYSKLTQGDSFYSLFLSDVCLGKACYLKCKYKYNSSSADIRIGDLWGSLYKENEEGVSGVATFTECGEEVVKKMEKYCLFMPLTFIEVGQGQMKISPEFPLIRKFTIQSIRKNKLSNVINFIRTYRKLIRLKKMIMKPHTLFKKNFI